jgi:hypothetical protein
MATSPMVENNEIFLKNKYSTWYFNIIRSSLLRLNIDEYIEKHHIIPKCMGGTNDKENLVNLTAKEHFICHLLLTKMTTGSLQKKMIFAFCMMSVTSDSNQQRYKITSRLFESMRIQRTHSEESRNKMSESHKGLTQTEETIEKRVRYIRGKKSPIKGKIIHTDESKKLIGDAQSALIKDLTPEELSQRMLNSCCNPDVYTVERGKKISISNTGRKFSDTSNWRSRKCVFVSPTGSEFNYNSLTEGCKFHNFNYGTIKSRISFNNTYKGWKINYV